MSLEARLLREAAYSLSGTDPQETQALLQMAAAKIDELHTLLADRDARLAALEGLYLNSLADATQWQLYKARKDAVIAAGMGRKAMRDAAAGAAPVPCVVLTPGERAAFERFHETWEDNEGYDVPKEMMRRLAEVGVVHHITAGRYDITKFGHYVLAAGAAPMPNGHRLVSVEALTKWRNAFAEELSAWDIDPPLHHVQTSHDELSAILAAAPKEPT